jgi:predicted transcriptional regulator
MTRHCFNMDKFAAVIELYIAQSNLTNAEFAELCGIGVSTLYAMKNGETAPNMAQFTNVCNLVNIEPSAFFKGRKQ